jgi:hypothetical protein
MAAAISSATTKEKTRPSAGSKLIKAIATSPYTDPTERSISRTRIRRVSPIAIKPRMAVKRVMLRMVIKLNQLRVSTRANMIKMRTQPMMMVASLRLKNFLADGINPPPG